MWRSVRGGSRPPRADVLLTRSLEAALPSRLEPSFRWLVGSSWISNLGDGMAHAAGPLLVASQTRDPFLVAMSALLQHLPWLLFGLHAGAVADWVDRRRLAVLVDLARTTVLVMLTVIVVTGNVSSGPCWSRSSCWARARSSLTRRPSRCCRWWSTRPISV